VSHTSLASHQDDTHTHVHMTHTHVHMVQRPNRIVRFHCNRRCCPGGAGAASKTQPTFCSNCRCKAPSNACALDSRRDAKQAMGADFGYVGSAFIATHEARAADAYAGPAAKGDSTRCS
jgi:hypothetical protein